MWILYFFEDQWWPLVCLFILHHLKLSWTWKPVLYKKLKWISSKFQFNWIVFLLRQSICVCFEIHTFCLISFVYAVIFWGISSVCDVIYEHFLNRNICQLFINSFKLYPPYFLCLKQQRWMNVYSIRKQYYCITHRVRLRSSLSRLSFQSLDAL